MRFESDQPGKEGYYEQLEEIRARMPEDQTQQCASSCSNAPAARSFLEATDSRSHSTLQAWHRTPLRGLPGGMHGPATDALRSKPGNSP